MSEPIGNHYSAWAAYLHHLRSEHGMRLLFKTSRHYIRIYGYNAGTLEVLGDIIPATDYDTIPVDFPIADPLLVLTHLAAVRDSDFPDASTGSLLAQALLDLGVSWPTLTFSDSRGWTFNGTHFMQRRFKATTFLVYDEAEKLRAAYYKALPDDDTTPEQLHTALQWWLTIS